MQKQIQQYIDENNLFDRNSKLLVAVSGGADSMVLLWLLQKCNVEIVVAHCNFNLRATDSDLDQQLVQKYCQVNGVQLFVKSFNTIEEAKAKGISIEMAARDLRYQWFDELSAQVSADYIATGHHCNDNVETVFLNMTRGTGLRGICGMKSKNGTIVRPLLWALRSDIEEFAHDNNIPYRTDHTNIDTAIPRNRFRHNVIPEIEAINPSFMKTMSSNMAIWNDWFVFSQQMLQQQIKKSFQETEFGFSFRFNTIQDFTTQRLLFVEFLIGQGYNGIQAGDMARILNAQVGTTIQSLKFQFVRERLSVELVRAEEHDEFSPILISTLPFSTQSPIFISIEQKSYEKSMGFSKSNTEIWIDASKVQWPLTIRRWIPGDIFQPIGMRGSKKVSDFLTDIKITASAKQRQCLLTDTKGVIWVVGQRMDRRFAITDTTQEVLIIRS
ncbi:MAG: tRNA lysidine(34) synthetase TilS [Salinivirgaceae bacterium]|nr:tRNA lysidine(34) synthetase TilS [Salinivirgaceae bacterium]